ncbi:MAG: GtrA family protein [Sphaerochaetaceae bacterium]|jgi:putative flippase GtrA
MENKTESIAAEQNPASRKKVIMQAIKFVLFSASAGLVQTGVFALLHDAVKAFGQSYWPSYLIALVCSVIWNFTLNRNFTFKSAANVPVAMLKILIYYCIFTPLSTWWGDALEAAHWNAYLILFGTMFINMLTEFCVYKFIVFRKTEDTLPKKEREVIRSSNKKLQ